MNKLKGFQKKYLRGLAHGLKPVVFIGKSGVTDTVVDSVDAALLRHELIKVKYVDFKEKEIKKSMAETIEARTNCEIAGMIGHMAILYRRCADPEKRKITLPSR
ncbi:MAG: YhbY family RNA-binding protein [Desulfobacterales bacterium]|nr:YhbY family RNA-binding protein [Desulfobacterales bacterium]